VIAHPECRWEVCQKADAVGSTEGLLTMIREAPSGAMFAVGAEIHLVNRMGKEFAAEGKKVITLDDSGCLCTTMFRISPQHLCWVLENLVEGNVVNQIKVKDDVKHWARWIGSWKFSSGRLIVGKRHQAETTARRTLAEYAVPK
jgi:quinolinate synthase